MADELIGKTVQIVSVEGGLPIGVNRTKLPFQVVYAGAPVSTWRFERAEEGTFCLSVGGYQFVGVNEDHEVVASVDPDQPVKSRRWRIVRKEDAFIIEEATEFWPKRVWATSGYEKPVKVRIAEFPGLVRSELFEFTPAE